MMKHSNALQVVGAGILASGIAIVPLTMPAFAQSSSSPSTNTTSSGTDNAPRQAADNRDNGGSNWGLLGLIGLAGLAGLAKGKRSEPVAYRDPNVNP